MWKCEYVDMWFNNMDMDTWTWYACYTHVACVVKRVAGVQE